MRGGRYGGEVRAESVSIAKSEHIYAHIKKDNPI